MKKLILILTLFVPLISFSQKDTIEKAKTIYVVETMPEFPGGEQAMIKFIIRNIEYPKIAKDNDIQGKVYIRFIVEKNGEITEIETVKEVNPELDNEAKRVIKMMPKWTPGTQEGKPVRVTFTLPINFSLK